MPKIAATAFISQVEEPLAFPPWVQCRGKTPALAWCCSQAPFSTGLPSEAQATSPTGRKGNGILGSRDLPCFCTTDSNQDTVFLPPFSLTELIPVHLQAHGERGGEEKERERESP